MTEQRKASRWAWFLFESGLTPGRAKQLLADWSELGLTLETVLDKLPAQAREFGLTPSEAAQLAQRGKMDVKALTWDDIRYPQGLLSLPLKLRPALLFYEGDSALLDRTLVYLVPAELPSDEDREMLRETISLVLGEHLLLGVYQDSAQALMLFEEMTYTEGEALLFASTGLAARSISDVAQALVDAGRLLVISPLAPDVGYRPAWEPILREVAATAADRLLVTGEAARHPAAVIGLGHEPALAISGEVPAPPVPDNVQSTTMPADALLWLDNLLAEAADLAAEPEDLAAETSGAPTSAEETKAEGLTEMPPGPPPSPEEILTTLERGGKIPDVLRQRLLGDENT